MVKTANKGEWSELYAFFKLLGDKVLYKGDENLNPIKDVFYPIIKIIRENKDYKIDSSSEIIFIKENGDIINRISVTEFKRQSIFILNKINENTGAFAIPEIEEFMNMVSCSSIKAPSTDKTDIKIVIHDIRTGICPTLGFSIKSELGAKSTLVNTSKATEFIYNIQGYHFSKDEINEINSISSRSKIKDRINMIYEKGGKLVFSNMTSSTFSNNLVVIDSLLPNILSEMILMYFCHSISDINILSRKLQEINPIGYDTSLSHKFYEYKIKHLLTDFALGMLPSKKWNGNYDANGGFLIVKEDGDILCYHIYDKYYFEEYIINNTRFDTPSSSRHNYGTIEEVDNNQIFKLNFQIRFK